MKLVVCERFLNVQSSKQRGKNGSWSGSGGAGDGEHTKVQPAQWLIRPWLH